VYWSDYGELSKEGASNSGRGYIYLMYWFN